MFVKDPFFLDKNAKKGQHSDAFWKTPSKCVIDKCVQTHSFKRVSSLFSSCVFIWKNACEITKSSVETRYIKKMMRSNALYIKKMHWNAKLAFFLYKFALQRCFVQFFFSWVVSRNVYFCVYMKYLFFLLLTFKKLFHFYIIMNFIFAYYVFK